jgi:hypothetical protein
MKDLWAHSYVDVYFIAMTYAGVGGKDQVFRWLEKGYEELCLSKISKYMSGWGLHFLHNSR